MSVLRYVGLLMQRSSVNCYRCQENEASCWTSFCVNQSRRKCIIYAIFGLLFCSIKRGGKSTLSI